ncbi:hypothetical protein [Frankia sp. QA3]|uniref:hypothetical protein n=1 Tax=Frankia sp. QA3 TaxID=710111 RepID=UPI000269BCD2|nr:hypothetical protein [Frankia sp. QA3]EIV92255.1 hypothetical protein FraQA3DRAFT_1788 [Frankia sp. QA3]
MSWKATAQATPDAPAVRAAHSDAEVVIRYHTAETSGDVRLPLVVWMGLAKAVRVGRLDRLGEAWSPWATSGGRVRLDGDRIVLGYGYLHRHEVRLPEPVWRALDAAVRAGTLDQLPHLGDRELAGATESAAGT